MAISTAQIIRSIQPGINTIIGESYKAMEEEYKKVGFKYFKATQRVEEDVMMSGFGEVPNDTPEGAPLVYDTAREGYTTRYVMTTKRMGFAITEEALEDFLHGSLLPKLAKRLKFSFVTTKARIAGNVFNNAFDSAYTGGDGVSLCSTAHPLTGGGTASNRLAVGADLSEASLEDMLTQVTTMIDERGLPCNLSARKLLVSSRGGNQFEAARILQSKFRPGTDSNDINAIAENNHIPDGFYSSQFFTDEDAFFLLTDVEDGLKYFERAPFTSKMEGEFNTGNMRHKCRERYAMGWSDFRGVFGSPGQ